MPSSVPLSPCFPSCAQGKGPQIRAPFPAPLGLWLPGDHREPKLTAQSGMTSAVVTGKGKKEKQGAKSQPSIPQHPNSYPQHELAK